MVKVGEVTGSLTPSARAAPRIRVVLPAPRSPLTRTTSPGPSSVASRSPGASVSAALRVRAVTPARDSCASRQRDPSGPAREYPLGPAARAREEAPPADRGSAGSPRAAARRLGGCAGPRLDGREGA